MKKNIALVVATVLGVHAWAWWRVVITWDDAEYARQAERSAARRLKVHRALGIQNG